MSPRRAKAVADRVGDDPATALRDHLVDAASALIARVPLTTITTREIARAAGVSDGVLYNYFHDKNDLLVEALVGRFAHAMAAAGGRMPEPGSASIEANLASIAATLLELESEVIPMLAGVLADPPLFHQTLATLHADPLGPPWFRAPLVAYLEAERGLGRIRADTDVDAVVLLLLGSTSVLALTGQVTPGGVEEVPARLGAVVEELLRALRPG